MSTPKIIPANPLTFDATSENANPGDMVLDPTGTVNVIGFITRSGGDGRSNQVVQVFAPIGAPDTLTLVQTSAGAGILTLTWTLRNAAGTVQPNRIVGLSLVASGVVTFTRVVGSGILQATAQEAWLWGRTGAGGVLQVTITGASALTVTYDASNVSQNPGASIGQAVIP